MTREANTKDRKESVGRTAKVQFVFTGFTHDIGFRVFAFERVGEDRIRTKFSVRTELTLIRRYGIQLQELPLMCRAILERRNEVEQNLTATFTEDEMNAYARDKAAARAAAALRRNRIGCPPPPSDPPGELPARSTDDHTLAAAFVPNGIR